MFCTRQSQLAPYGHGCYQTVTFCTRQSRLASVSHGWHQTIAAQTADSIWSCNSYTIQSLHFISAAVIQLWLLLYKLRSEFQVLYNCRTMQYYVSLIPNIHQTNKQTKSCLIPSGCVLFCGPKRFRDFFLPREVWFFAVPRGCVIFFVTRGCVIFFLLEGRVIIFLSQNVAWYFLSREVAFFLLSLEVPRFFLPQEVAWFLLSSDIA